MQQSNIKPEDVINASEFQEKIFAEIELEKHPIELRPESVARALLEAAERRPEDFPYIARLHEKVRLEALVGMNSSPQVLTALLDEAVRHHQCLSEKLMPQ